MLMVNYSKSLFFGYLSFQFTTMSCVAGSSYGSGLEVVNGTSSPLVSVKNNSESVLDRLDNGDPTIGLWKR